MKNIVSGKVCLFFASLISCLAIMAPGTALAVCTIDKAGTYIEAEHFSGSTDLAASPDSTTRFTVVDITGTNNGQVLKSGSAGGAADTPSNEVKEYAVYFPEAGTYDIYMRGRGFSGGQDSMFFTLNNDTWKAWNFNGDYSGFIWTSSMQVDPSSTGNTITVSAAGNHTIKIAMREDTSEIDGFYVVETGGAAPTDATVPLTAKILTPHTGCSGSYWQINPTSVGTSAFVGFSADPLTFKITNIGDDDASTATISSNQTWLTLPDPTVPALATNQEHEVTLNFDSAGLAVNTYQAELTITGAAGNSPKKIPVTLIVEDLPTSSSCGDVPLYAENIVKPAIMVQLDTSGSMSTSMTIAERDNQDTPDLSTIVKEIVDRSGWVANNSLGFVIGGTTGTRRAWSWDGDYASAPTLKIQYDNGGTAVDIERKIVNSNDDVQMSGATLEADESYIEFGRSGEPVVLRFKSVNIPNGATINSAQISFSPYQGDTDTTAFTIHGIAADNLDVVTNPSTLTQTTATTNWSPGSWSESMSRINIAEDVLAEVFQDRAISWGFGTWSGGSCNGTDGDDSPDYYTEYLVGCHAHDDTHQTNLQAEVDSGSAGGCTPLVPTLKANLDYFKGTREDDTYTEKYRVVHCQPRIVVIVTDGLGNTATTDTGIDNVVDDLIAEGVTVVAVGFGLTNATQLDRIVQKMQTAGEANDDDYLYHLHNEVSGVAVPFMAQNRNEFIQAMNDIVENLKTQIFKGSTPAPTTSADNGDVLLLAEFNPAGWNGNLTATKFNPYTGELNATPEWKAVDVMPSAKNAFIYDNSISTKVNTYTDSSITGDDYLCKTLGDIINSTPIIVGAPPFVYRFDSYFNFKHDYLVNNREPLVYVSSNDGALHAFKLSDGTEKWRFYPEGVKSKLALAETDPKYNMCSDQYCHDFVLDGSPYVADIYDSTDGWKTIVTTGQGRGGDSFFTLDITYGEDFDEAPKTPPGGSTAVSVASRFLWELDETDIPEIGLTTSQPSIRRVKDDSIVNGTGWVTFFGSGKAETDTAQNSKEAYVFAVDSYDKSQVWKETAPSTTRFYGVKLSSSPTLLNDIPSTPLVMDALDEDNLADRIYVGNRYGNMYRIKDIGIDENPVSQLFLNSETSTGTNPVTARAAFAFAGDNDIWLYYGTGKFQDQIDKYTKDQQYFYGLYDEDANRSTAYKRSDLATVKTDIIEAYAIDTTLPGADKRVDLNKDGTIDALDKRRYRTVYCDTPDVNGLCNAAMDSWVMELYTSTTNPSERSITQALVVGGITFFVTFIPDTDVCAGSGEVWLFAVDWKQGEYVSEPVFDLNENDRFDADDKHVMLEDGTIVKAAAISVGSGRPPKELAIHNDLVIVGKTNEAPSLVKVNIKDKKAKLKAWRQYFQTISGDIVVPTP